MRDTKEDVTVIPYYDFIYSLTNTERPKDRGITQEEENDLQIDVS
jgi:hypothetical protein